MADPAILLSFFVFIWSLFSILQTQVLFIEQQRSYYLNNKRKINLIDMKKGEKSMGVIFQLAAGYGCGINHKGRRRRRRW